MKPQGSNQRDFKPIHHTIWRRSTERMEKRYGKNSPKIQQIHHEVKLKACIDQKNKVFTQE
jgi:hypothetical protein